MKTCPYCAEEIQDAAIKCKHCFEFLDGSGRSGNPSRRDAPVERPWHSKNSFLILTLLTFPPFALPLVWMKPGLHVAWKLILSAGILVFCWISYRAFVQLAHSYDEAIQMINGMNL